MKSAPTSASWAISTTARRTRRRPTPRPSGNSSLIDVDILGHIFEQSITDLEKLRNELDGQLPSPSGRGAGGEGSVTNQRRPQDPPQEGRRVLHARVHHPLHHRTGAGRGPPGPFRATPAGPSSRRPRARPAPRWPIRASTPSTS